jgi:hypothetical protein
MSAKERDRFDVLSRVSRRELTLVKAAALLGLSVRQTRRVWKRFQAAGAKGLVHGGRGRASNRRLKQAVREKAIRLHQGHYRDFGPTHACEKLRDHRIAISPDTLVNLLKGHGLYEPMRKRSKHRRRRKRRECFGELVQADGSTHDWFEGRCAIKPTLMVAVDDATGITLARFHPAETTGSASDLFTKWCGAYGVPRGWYVDRHTIYRNNERPQRPTQFARAMTELSVELICANSPQAKGRVERRHRVFQDRLVKELRLRRISDLAQANALLEQVFLPEINRRYTQKPANPSDLHRVPPANLAEVLCRQQERVVGRDWCVVWCGRVLQIEQETGRRVLPRQRVLIRQWPDDRLSVSHRGRALKTRELSQRPPAKKARRKIVNNKAYKPAPTHPWAKRTTELRQTA